MKWRTNKKIIKVDDRLEASRVAVSRAAVSRVVVSKVVSRVAVRAVARVEAKTRNS
jgi:hypothetical protein